MKHSKISEKYQKWIIKYSSERHSKSVYFVWLTDKSDRNEADKFLLTKSEKIIVAKSKRDLLMSICKRDCLFPDMKRTKKWIAKSLKSENLSTTEFDLRKTEKRILSCKLKLVDLNKIVDFINIFDDYEYQIGKKRNELKTKKKELIKVWNFYYDNMVFLSFNEKDEQNFLPKNMQIKTKKLHKQFRNVTLDFENKFEFVK